MASMKMRGYLEQGTIWNNQLTQQFQYLSSSLTGNSPLTRVQESATRDGFNWILARTQQHL